MKQPRISVVDYGRGNVSSVITALRQLSYSKAVVASQPELLPLSDVLILPGVGAFGACRNAIRDADLTEALEDWVSARQKPILGICVGMQLMGSSSTEHGHHQGFGWIDGSVDLIKPAGQLAVPHVGWNEVEVLDEESPFFGVCNHQDFYFDHAYAFRHGSPSCAATTNYGGPICAIVARDNLVGVQFHPEKSQSNGLRFLRKFVDWSIRC